MFDLPKAQDFLKNMASARIRGDVDAIMEFFQDDAVFRVVGVATAEGRDDIRAAVQTLVHQFEFLEWDALDVVVHGGSIAVRQHLKVRSRQNGKVAETETAEFLTIKDGRCAAFTQYADTALVVALSQGGPAT